MTTPIADLTLVVVECYSFLPNQSIINHVESHSQLLLRCIMMKTWMCCLEWSISMAKQLFVVQIPTQEAHTYARSFSTAV